MMYAHARFSGDSRLLVRHVRVFLLCTFGAFLISHEVRGREAMGRFPRLTYIDARHGKPVRIILLSWVHWAHGDSRTTQDLSTGSTTNLALKGIIGIKAMAEISRAVGNGSDAQLYDVCASHFSSFAMCSFMYPSLVHLP